MVSDFQGLGNDIRKCLECNSEAQSTLAAAHCMVPRQQTGADAPPGIMNGSLPPGVRANEWVLSYTASWQGRPPLSLVVTLTGLAALALLVPLQMLRTRAVRLQNRYPLSEMPN